ncbi:MAG: hypothetical protein IPN19_05725 [Elusimicrobia bacterium]|nr:hypothetical protein [Elusimicrobiota bacterium]
MANSIKKNLIPFAAKYVWWKSPDEAIEYPERVVAYVLNSGTFEDVQKIVGLMGEDYLRGVVERAEVGWFNERSWHYWHYRLGMAKPNEVPEMKRRRVA